VATVVDGFAETDQYARFDFEPTMMVSVFRTGEQTSANPASRREGIGRGSSRRFHAPWPARSLQPAGPMPQPERHRRPKLHRRPSARFTRRE